MFYFSFILQPTFYGHDGSKSIIGSRVKEAHQEANPPLAQQDLSAKLGIMGFTLDRVSVSKIEAGDRFAPDYGVVALAMVLNVSLEWLLTGKG